MGKIPSSKYFEAKKTIGHGFNFLKNFSYLNGLFMGGEFVVNKCRVVELDLGLKSVYCGTPTYQRSL